MFDIFDQIFQTTNPVLEAIKYLKYDTGFGLPLGQRCLNDKPTTRTRMMTITKLKLKYQLGLLPYCTSSVI
jgi:hypothetical protein